MDSSSSAASRKRYREEDEEYDEEYDGEGKHRGAALSLPNPPKWLGGDVNKLVLTFNYCIDNMNNLVPDLFDKYVWGWLSGDFIIRGSNARNISKKLHDDMEILFINTLRYIEDNFKRDQENLPEEDYKERRKILYNMFIHRMREGATYFYRQLKLFKFTEDIVWNQKTQVNDDDDDAEEMRNLRRMKLLKTKLLKNLDKAIMVVFRFCKSKYDMQTKPYNPTYNIERRIPESRSKIDKNKAAFLLVEVYQN